MKIKLQEYSLISNEYLNKEIDHLNQIRTQCEGTAKDKIDMILFYFERLKEQLIPSGQLARACFENGTWMQSSNIDRELYFSSEIEIQ